MIAPLKGLRILDFTTLLPGPFGTQMLADLGAEVVRIESPARADIVRQLQPQVAGQSAAFHTLNRGKKSLALNLKQKQATAIIEQLLADYDVLIEQFRPGVMAKLGLGYQQLQALHPRLIYCSITGYGQDGPLAARAGHDINYLARSGLSSYLGRAGQGPLPLPTQVADIAGGGQNAVIAILAALFERQRSGRGQHIDISMTDSCLALNALFGPGALHTGADPEAEAHPLTGAGIYDYYRTADDRYLSVGSLEPRFRQRLCQRIGHADWQGLADETLKPKLWALFEQQPLSHWQRLFEDADACVEPVLTLNEATASELFQSRAMLTRGAGEQGPLQIACPLRFSGQRPQARSPAPTLGQHNEEILSTLGYSRADVALLAAQGLFD